MVELKTNRLNTLDLIGAEVVQINQREREDMDERVLSIKIKKNGRVYWVTPQLQMKLDTLKAIMVIEKARV